MVEPDRQQMKIWRHVACRIIKATRAQAHARDHAPTPTHMHAHKHTEICKTSPPPPPTPQYYVVCSLSVLSRICLRQYLVLNWRYRRNCISLQTFVRLRNPRVF